MSHLNSHPAEQYWLGRAANLAWRLNFHHWLTRTVPLLSGILLVLAVFEIFRREMALPVGYTSVFFILGMVIGTGWAWFHARKHFCNRDQALVRLETILGMHNRLSAAQAGVLSWPAPMGDSGDGYRANWKKILVPLLAGCFFLWAAHLIPVSHLRLGSSHDPISPPPDFVQVQNWINALKAEELIEPAKLQEMQAALDKLKERPAQDWYTQGNLEAANSLKELTEQSMNSLAQDLNQADEAVQVMKEKAENPDSAGNLEAMQDELRKAGNSLASGNLPLKKELVDQLKGAESANDKSLNAQQLKALQARLEKGEQAAQTAPKGNGNLSKEMQDAMAKADMEGGNGRGHRRMEKVGPGELGGGKESAPLQLQNRDEITTAGTLTPVSNSDLSRASIGETLKVSAGEHKVDPTAYRGNQNAGTAPVTGNGGEAVWRSTYDPQEAETLTRFFQ